VIARNKNEFNFITSPQYFFVGGGVCKLVDRKSKQKA